jgi:hypothetical protein
MAARTFFSVRFAPGAQPEEHAMLNGVLALDGSVGGGAGVADSYESEPEIGAWNIVGLTDDEKHASATAGTEEGLYHINAQEESHIERLEDHSGLPHDVAIVTPLRGGAILGGIAPSADRQSCRPATSYGRNHKYYNRQFWLHSCFDPLRSLALSPGFAGTCTFPLRSPQTAVYQRRRGSIPCPG